MNSDQVEIAVAVADTLSFSDAARLVSTSPSSVSRQLQTLETELGIRIFNRGARAKVTLTPEGEAILPYLRSMQELNKDLKQKIDSINGSEILRIISLPHLNSVESVILNDFLLERPQAQVIEYSLSPSEAFRYILTGKADVCLTTYFSSENEEQLLSDFGPDAEKLSHYVIARESGYIMLNASHPLAKNKVITLEDIAEFKNVDFYVISFSEEICKDYKEKIDNWCIQKGLDLMIRPFEARSVNAGELLNSYIGSHPNSMTILRDVLLRRDDCVKIPFFCPDLTFTSIVYCRKDNNSVNLKFFKKSVRDYVSKRNKK